MFGLLLDWRRRRLFAIFLLPILNVTNLSRWCNLLLRLLSLVGLNTLLRLNLVRNYYCLRLLSLVGLNTLLRLNLVRNYLCLRLLSLVGLNTLLRLNLVRNYYCLRLLSLIGLSLLTHLLQWWNGTCDWPRTNLLSWNHRYRCKVLGVGRVR